MYGAICYYSGSGNTKLACEYLARHAGLEFDLVDVIVDSSADLSAYDVVVLAASTDFGGVPQRFETFLAELPQQDGKPAFVLNTFGLASGRTLHDLAELAGARGFTVLGGHSLRMPESYPPMLAIHLAFANQPRPRQVRKFDRFIAQLGEIAGGARRAGNHERSSIPVGLMSRLSRTRDRTTARDDMGAKSVDVELCTECGTCAQRCPYAAITLAPKPVFDMGVCRGCWRCYNQCPQHAISTAKFRGGPFYSGPSLRAREALRG